MYSMLINTGFTGLQNDVTGNLASIHYEQGQLDMAILHYKQAIACDPRFLEAYNNLVGFFSSALQFKTPRASFWRIFCL